MLVAISAAQQRSPAANTVCGPPADQSLKCSEFGFVYKIPFGWVDRTAEMQSSDSKPAAAQAASGAPTDTQAQRDGKPDNNGAGSSASSRTLLAVFERPPEARGETINSAVIIVAESKASYPQVKTAADYFGPVSDLAERGGLKPENDPYRFSVGTRQLVREDFSGQRGRLPIWQSSLVIIEKGQIVSFTFISASEDDVEDLIASLSFRPIARSSPGSSR